MKLGLLFSFLICICGHYATATIETDFQEGVKLYQEKNFEKSKEAFEKALNQQPDNPVVLTNLALAQFQLGQKGWTIALLRRAISLDPDFSTPRAAMEFVLPQLEVKEIPHDIQFSENLRSLVLNQISIQGFYFITAILLAGSAWLLLRYWGRRRTAAKEEKAYPPFPSVAVLLSLLLLISLFLTIFKTVDSLTARGTIVADKVSVMSLPQEKSVALFDLYPGLEVIIERQENDWAQVTYPGGLTGWIPLSSIFRTSGGK